jgi:SAM-dependent methyltransferase
MKAAPESLRAGALCLSLLLAACGGGPASVRQSTPTPAPAQTPSRASVKLDVPYVPTPDAVVERMLRMAKVGKDDVVYDLGCGDGRIVITAARKYGARGVGYDLNPQRISESNANARAAGVDDRVRFVQGDLFQADLREASVVMLYLLPDVNLKLRPKLLDELKPGTRVVSHNYDMGDWEPQESDEVDIQGSTHYIYSWVIPEKR